MTPPQSSASVSARTSVPFWRDVRVLTILAQIIFVVAVAVAGGYLYANLASAMQRRGLVAGFDFINNESGFEIGETLIPYQPTDTYGRAFLAGFLNTLWVSIVGIILTTILGVSVGIARLSPNFLLSRLAAGFIEIIRNTPLLVQLFFIYFGVFVRFPSVAESLQFPGPSFGNQRGLFFPKPIPLESFPAWAIFVVAGIFIALALWIASGRGQSKLPLGWLGFAALIAFPIIGSLLLPAPFEFEIPVRERFNFKGGLHISPEFGALLTGLVIYTAGFIAEVVRSGIQAVKRGQVEAAYALGLRGGQVLRLVIFPQALRVMLPPMTSQYLNLAKNSSLAIAIGFPDLFSVTATIANQTGQPVPVILLVMVTYLAISLFTSLLMNIYNRYVQILEK
ncbi:MAG: ABC transporter permease subunit [Chloroflexi bacterium]|nr:ABC transporter permease subunit [Chloroflexota bacterium]